MQNISLHDLAYCTGGAAPRSAPRPPAERPPDLVQLRKSACNIRNWGFNSGEGNALSGLFTGIIDNLPGAPPPVRCPPMDD